MPLYEYQCESCQHRFEKIQKYSDPLVDTCPSCGGVVKKLFSSPAIQFKGTGWYITDYAKKNTSDAGKRASDDNSSAKDSSSSASSDSASTSATSATPPATSTTDAGKKD
jgi:putative FmdB family regulatory protein